MKKISTALFVFFALLTANMNAQEPAFEGIIEFQKQTDDDTMSFRYYIKGDKICVDEMGAANFEEVGGSYLIDLKEKKMIAVSHARHLYFEQPPSSVLATVKGTPEVIKTKNTKVILGVKCTEYIVKSKEENTQISYWLASGGYNFFLPMVKFLNRKDKSSVYFSQLTGVEGMFPFLSVETGLDGKDERVKLVVTKIKKQKVDAGRFNIPKGYQKGAN